MWLIVIMNVCFASALPLLKYISMAIEPVLLVAIRMSLGGLLLCGYQLWRDRSAFRRPLPWGLLCGTGLVTMYFLCIAEAWALTEMQATKATLFWAALPLFTIGAEWCYGTAPVLSWSRWCALGCGMAGMVMVACIQNPADCWHAVWSLPTRYDGGMLLAVVAAAVGYPLLQQVAVRSAGGVVLHNGIMMFVAGIAAGLTTVVRAWLCVAELVMPAGKTIGLIALVVLVVNLLGLGLQTYLVRFYAGSLLALSSFLTPVIGMVLGSCVLGEPMSIWYLCAGLLVMTGLMLWYGDEAVQVPRVSYEN